MKPLLKTILLAAMFGVAIAHAESGTALKADTLRAEPFADAKAAGKIARNDKLEIIEKKGAWLRVRTPKSSGWVRLLSVKRGATAKSNEAAGVLNVASGRAGTGQVVSTTGVRGLNEEELKAARFSEEEVASLERYLVTAEQAREFAAAGGLKERRQDYLPKPGKQGSNP